jgi:hypothetical protein
MRGSAALTVRFAGPGQGSSGALSVLVDDAATAANSPYSPGSSVVLRLIGRHAATILTTSLGCNLSLTSSNQTFSHTEILTVIKADRVNLSYPAKITPELKWLAIIGGHGGLSLDPDDPGTVVFSKEIRMGIAEVTYDVSYDKYVAAQLTGQTALALFEASDGRDCSIELDILQASAVRQDVKLVVIDYSTDAVIAGANVTITGPFGYYFNGASDAQGVIRLTGLPPGEYNLLATRAGYQATNQDILANDRFTL